MSTAEETEQEIRRQNVTPGDGDTLEGPEHEEPEDVTEEEPAEGEAA